MKDTVQHMVDAKSAAAGAGSVAGAIVAAAERFGPVIEAVAGVVSIVAGCLAIWWTIMRIRDGYKARQKAKEKSL